VRHWLFGLTVALAALSYGAAASPAAALPPGSLEVAMELDETPLAAPLESAITRELKLTVTRPASVAAVRGKLVVLPPEGPDVGARRVELPFDLSSATTATVTTPLAIPAGHGIIDLKYPIEVWVGDELYQVQDLYVTKGPAVRVIGPFEGGSLQAHDTVYPPEKELDFTAVYEGKGGRMLRWRPVPGQAFLPNGILDLNIGCEDADEATAYLTFEVAVPAARKATVSLGSDDSVKVWLNGKQVHSNPVEVRGVTPGEDKFDVELQAGTNIFLLKVCDNYGGWGASFELLDEAGQAFAGLQDRVALARTYPRDALLRLQAVTRDSATVTWRSDIPGRGVVTVRKAIQGRAEPFPGPLPKSDMVKPDPSAKPIIVDTGQVGMSHQGTVTGLEPGTRYIITTEPAIGGRSSEPLSFYTSPPDGQTQVLHLKLVCAVFTNVVERPSADKEGAQRPVERTEVERLKWQLSQTSRFYYVNSGMRMVFDIDYLIDDRHYVIGDEIYGVGFSEHNEDEKLLAKLVEERGGRLSDYDGTVLISFVKRWDERPGEWVYPHGGGGTLGILPVTGLGKCAWRAGRNSNDAWLMCHEFQHQLDSIYHESMQPEHLFCHFQPWDDTAHRHGEHWDGIAWIFREWAGYVTREQQGWPLQEPTLGFRYFTSRWGTVVPYDDRDNDGIPDDAPNLPLDEVRLGSDPTKVDTDGDGLTDMKEALASNWSVYGLGYTWAGEPWQHRCDPRNPDTDGDGIPDGQDPYPLYPVNTKLRKGGATLSDKDFQPFVSVRDRVYIGTYALAWNDEYFAIRIRSPQVVRHMRLCLDNDIDGWFVGHDNYDIEIFPRGGGRPSREWHGNADGTLLFGFHNCGVVGKWPFYDPTGLGADELTLTQSITDDGYAAELRIPRNAANGLPLVPGDKIGLMLTIMPEGGILRPGQFNALSVFEPHTFIAVELTE
jgi:hypothetical protein